MNWPQLGRAILRLLDERHIQIWLADEAAQAVVQRQGWDGAIRTTAGDYLMVVDSNLGFNKVNAQATTAILYEVTLKRDAPAEANLQLSHQNPSRGEGACVHKPRYGDDYWEIINRCYWDYLRVYAPSGSRLKRATPHPLSGKFLLSQQDEPARVDDLPPEMDKTVWGTLLMVPHRATLQTTFQYTLPERVIQKTAEGWRYTLLVQKQAGTLANELQVILNLPPGSRLVKTTPAPVERDAAGQVIFDLRLDQDRRIEVVFD